MLRSVTDFIDELSFQKISERTPAVGRSGRRERWKGRERGVAESADTRYFKLMKI